MKALALSLFLFASPAMSETVDISAVVVMACGTPYGVIIAKSDGAFDAYNIEEFLADPAAAERVKELQAFVANILDPELCGLNVI
jgi:hypothetical protein